MTIVRVVVCVYHPNFKCLHPHLRVVSRRERGKKLPYPARSREEAFPYLRAEPLSVSGTH